MREFIAWMARAVAVACCLAVLALVVWIVPIAAMHGDGQAIGGAVGCGAIAAGLVLLLWRTR